MKKLIYATLLSTIIGCSNSKDNEAVNNYIAYLDDMTLDEIKEDIDSDILWDKHFILDAEVFYFDYEIENINKQNERYNTPFKIDTSKVYSILNQFSNIQFTQSFNKNKSVLNFKYDPLVNIDPFSINEHYINELYIPNKIYYHNGEVKTDNINNYKFFFGYAKNWGPTKLIDSIDFTYKLNYLKNYEVIELSSKNSKVNYKGGEIILKKMEGNYSYITLSDTIPSPIKTEGYTIENKVLNSYTSINSYETLDISMRIYKEKLNYYKKLQEKLNNNDFKNTAELQTHLKKTLGTLELYNKTDETLHKQKYYYGNVNSVKIYFRKEMGYQQTTFRARNIKSFNKGGLFEMYTDNGLVFINDKGEQEIEIKNSDSKITKIGGAFYESDNYFYLLNKEKKQLDTLLVYNIKAFNHNLIGIQNENRNDNYSLLSNDNKPINNKMYNDLKNIEDILIGIRENKHYIINSNGKEVLLKDVIAIENEISDDRIIVRNAQGNYGFTNTKGKIVIPIKYNYAMSFQDGYTKVKFNGTCKIINVNGNIITETGEKFLGYCTKDEEGRRIYNFSNHKKSYNYKGELIEK